MVNDVHRQSFHFDTEDTPDTTLQSSTGGLDGRLRLQNIRAKKRRDGAPTRVMSMAGSQVGDVPVRSAVFASSSSSRKLPWNAFYAHGDVPVPSSATYADGPLHFRSISSPRAPSSKSSAAFASSVDRFAKPRKAAEFTPVVDAAVYDAGALVSSVSQAGRPSASFVSTSARMSPRGMPTPGPGAYTPTDPTASRSAGAIASGKCASFHSSSSRRLPFEPGGWRGTDLGTPGPTAYQNSSAADFRGTRGDVSRAPAKGASAMGFTSPRFGSGHYGSPRHSTPGPGAYGGGAMDRLSMASATSGMLPSSAERRLPLTDIRVFTPGPGNYREQRPGIGDSGVRRSASFADRSRRMAPKSTLSQGPHAYADAHYQRGAFAVANVLKTGTPRPLRRSASFSSGSTRFKSQGLHVPGPGAYEGKDGMGSPRRSSLARSSFASTSARTQLPFQLQGATATPGAGQYEHAQPIRDAITSQTGPRGLRRSASFESRAVRNLGGVTKAAAASPGPGYYSPRAEGGGRAAASATQRYSLNRMPL